MSIQKVRARRKNVLFIESGLQKRSYFAIVE